MKKSLTWGTFPKDFLIEVDTPENIPYEITTPFGSRTYKIISSALNNVDYTAESMETETRRCKFSIHDPESLKKLILNLITLSEYSPEQVEPWHTTEDEKDAEEAGSLASGLMSTLGYEWI